MEGAMLRKQLYERSTSELDVEADVLDLQLRP
jgi:hypothetical protein